MCTETWRWGAAQPALRLPCDCAAATGRRRPIACGWGRCFTHSLMTRMWVAGHEGGQRKRAARGGSPPLASLLRAYASLKVGKVPGPPACLNDPRFSHNKLKPKFTKNRSTHAVVELRTRS